MKLLGPLEWECGKTLEGGGEFFLDLSYMRWEIGLRLRFWLDLWCENHPLTAIFWNCLVSLS